MLKNILAITGKPGLYKLINHGNNMLIVESLVDGKRMPTYGRDKIISLADVSMFTLDEDLPLSEVLTRLGEKEGLKAAGIDAKNADNNALRTYFASFVPNYDVDRVYPSDIRKLVLWYNILINAGITDFTAEEEENREQITENRKQITENRKQITRKLLSNKPLKPKKQPEKPTPKQASERKKVDG